MLQLISIFAILFLKSFLILKGYIIKYAFNPWLLFQVDIDTTERISFKKKAIADEIRACIRLQKTISIIIPCFNEESTILYAVESGINDERVKEVIVVDGGSTDASMSLLRGITNRKLKIFEGGTSRASAQNIGAASATGAVLLFLHADCTLPSGFGDAVFSTLETVGVLVGAFSFATDGAPSQLLRLIEIGTNLRSRFFQLPYGDQALFVFRGVFQRLGRFPQIPFMEDFDFVIHARQLGKVAVSPLKVHSSARRWRQQGTISNTLRNQFIIWGRLIGMDIDTLAAWYYGSSRKKTY